jgi:hypothetical protein
MKIERLDRKLKVKFKYKEIHARVIYLITYIYEIVPVVKTLINPMDSVT